MNKTVHRRGGGEEGAIRVQEGVKIREISFRSGTKIKARKLASWERKGRLKNQKWELLKKGKGRRFFTI